MEVVDDFKFLGIMFNKHLKWTTHIDMIANKISKYIRVLNRIKHTLPPRILITLYNTLIHVLPDFYYGIPLWGHHPSRLHKLKTILQNQKRSCPSILRYDLIVQIKYYYNFSNCFIANLL